MTFPDSNKFFNCSPIANETKKYSCQVLRQSRSLESEIVCCTHVLNITTIDSDTISRHCSSDLCSELSTNSVSTSVIIIVICFSLFLLIGLSIVVTLSVLKKKRRAMNVDSNFRSSQPLNDESARTNSLLPEAANTSTGYMDVTNVASSSNEYTDVAYINNEECELPEQHAPNAVNRQHHIQRMVGVINNQDASMISSRLPLKEQTDVIPYVPKLEIHRQNFTIQEKLGGGNFGTVFKGETIGLYYPGSKTVVAVKTINDSFSWNDINALLSEIKILSHVSLHCNLVSMVGVCTTTAQMDGKIFVLLEFCDKGDLKDFLIQNRKQFIDSFTTTRSLSNPIHSRLLIQWAYDISMGMEYLAEKRIMHGDLAARNILLDSGGNYKEKRLVAKISDFGLSKQMLENKYYEKFERNFVPWRWMAFEFLQDGKFQLKSDVWSYGVVIWEIFSLGKEPYHGRKYDYVLEMLERGEHLPCPEDVKNVCDWPASHIYEELAQKCFALQVEERDSFSDLVLFIRSKLIVDELKCYEQMTKKCDDQNALLFDENTRKRLSLSPRKNVNN